MSDAVPEPAAQSAAQETEAGPEVREAESGYEPAVPAPLDVPRAPTGNAEVDARLARLADADHLATDGHVEVYEDVHRGLRDALTALDARPGPPAPSTAPTSPTPPTPPTPLTSPSSYEDRS
ncbi:hypothetical protein [Streptomyces sp. AC512_CC834]|uniref:hypothetical protein n=1 Tax=Streptomyces sp. AC512_CC834 TaxID=2823691 RepID=UPI001C251BA7|nr:hypothetical protein [Streptomyces sp. AC512_CC834]